MSTRNIDRIPIRAMLLCACMLVALLVRTVFNWETVFGGEFVRFTETDAWYHLRLIDNLLANFFSASTYDPYLRFPAGQNHNVAPGLDTLVVLLALLLGAGAPDTALVERIAALLPALLGAALVLPVYATGRSVFSPRAGLFAAGLIAILPGELLIRTTLGFADHHAAEVFFSTVALWLFVRAMQADSSGTATRRGILAGLALGLYLAMWSGGALFVLALTLAVWIATWQSHDEAAGAGFAPARVYLTTVAVAGVLVITLLRPYTFAPNHLIALAGGAVSVVMLTLLSAVMRRAGLCSGRALALAGCALVGGVTALFWLAAPELADNLAIQIRRLIVPTTMMVGEAAPLFAADLPWPNVLFRSFGLVAPVAILAVVPAARLAREQFGATLVLAWFAVSGAAMIGQVRFGYYFAVPIALLAGLACDRLLARWPRRQEILFVLLLLVLYVPCAQLSRAQVAKLTGPSDDWHAALEWMRDNTPEPFGSPDAYFDSYAGLSESNPYAFPDSAYGVLSWWDSGYWIIRMARRIPHANPTQTGLEEAAQFFLATDESIAAQQLQALGSRYVIASNGMVSRHGISLGTGSDQFDAMMAGVDAQDDEFFETYLVPVGQGLYMPRTFYYPRYYQTMATRLYAYGGQAAQPQGSVFVLHYAEQSPADGQPDKILLSLQPAASYAEAVEAVRNDPDQRSRVVGLDPFRTCIPLPALEYLAPVYASPGSDERASQGDGIEGPALVQIFEYRGERRLPDSQP